MTIALIGFAALMLLILLRIADCFCHGHGGVYWLCRIGGLEF